MVTSVDVARLLGLSQSTVSRALRGDDSVAPATRERVITAADELGYVPDIAARMMVTRRSRAVGVVVGDLTSPIYPPILQALQDRLLHYGYRMVLIRDPDALPDPGAVDVLSDTTVDGMIFLSARRGSTALERVHRRRTPVILLSRDDDSADTEAVLADDWGAGYMALSHLIELGHSRIGILTTSRNRSNGRGREAGARDAMEEFGIPVRENWILSLPLTHEDGMNAAHRLLQAPERPTAFFCVADTFAFATLDAAARLSIQVPRELSVVGVDDSGPSRWAFINLTTVHQPIVEMSRDAVDRLVKRIDGVPREQEAKTVFPVSLEIRGTTMAPNQP